MSNVTQTQATTASVTLVASTTPKVTNLNVTSAGNEFSHALTSGLRQLMVRSRVGANIQFCWTTGETNTKYMTISRNSVLELQDLSFTGKVLYLQADKIGIVEIHELY